MLNTQRQQRTQTKRILFILLIVSIMVSLVLAAFHISSTWANEVAEKAAAEQAAKVAQTQAQASNAVAPHDTVRAEQAAAEPVTAATEPVAVDATLSEAAVQDAVPASQAQEMAQAAAPAEDSLAPKAKSISFDADELLFGKKGDKLRLITSVEPAGADVSGITFKSTDESVAIVNSKGVVKAKGWGVCKIIAKVEGKKAKCKVTVAKKWVALTFDDGPGAYTNKLLNAMKKRGVRGTFFVVGQMAKSRTDVLKKTIKNGNEIGNHTWAHNGSAGVLIGALNKTDNIVKKATGEEPALMRPPGGGINSTTKQCGKPIILWSVDPKDWRDRNANTVYNRVIGSTRSGSIVLLHDIHATSVSAAYNIMDKLKSKGYAFVTVSELLGKPKANKIYNSGNKKVRTMKINYASSGD